MCLLSPPLLFTASMNRGNDYKKDLPVTTLKNIKEFVYCLVTRVSNHMD